MSIQSNEQEQWSQDSHKNEERIVDYRKRRTEHTPILIDWAVVEQVESFNFLGVHITTNKLTLSKHNKTVVKRAWQNLFPMGMGPQILKRFYSCTIESILTGCITAWYGNCSASDHKALQSVVCTAQYITGAKLPATQDFYTRQCQRKALKIVKTPATPGIDCSLCYRTSNSTRSAKSRSKRLLNSFYPKAIRLLNI